MTKNKLLLLLVLLTMLSTRAVAQNDASAMRELMKGRIDELTALAPDNVKGLNETLRNDVNVYKALYTGWYNASPLKSYDDYEEAYDHLGFIIDRVNKYLAAYGEFTDNMAKLKDLTDNFNAGTEENKQGYKTFAQNVYNAYKALSEHDMIALDDDDVDAQKEYDMNNYDYEPVDVTDGNIADVVGDPSGYISTYGQFNAFFSQNNKELGSIYLEVAGTGTAESPENLTAQLRNPNLENAGEQWWGTDWTAFGNSAAEQSGKPFITYQQVHLPEGYYTLVGYGMDRRGSWADVLANDEDWNEDHRTYLFSHLDSDGIDSTMVDAFKAKNMALTADITNGAGNISTCEVGGVTYYTPNSMAQYRAWEDAKIAKTGNGHGAVLQFWVYQGEGDFGTLGFAQRWHVDNTWFVADGIQLYYAKDNFPNINIDTPIAPAAPGYSVTLAEGTEDANKWTVKVGEGEAKAFPVEGLNGGETVTATYKGEKKVKSVKAVKKAAPITDLATITADYEAKDGETLTGTLASNVKISIAAGATVTLKDVNITNLGVGFDWAGITCEGDATLVLEGTNTVCAGRGSDGYNNYPGIWIAPGKTLTIQGDGTLTAYSNADSPYAAGIGGGYKIACGNIVINSGTITATGGWNAAGIGGGNSASCGNITINGGTVTATGGTYGAGIGCGAAGENQGSCGNITISGGTVEATGGENAAGIGGGSTNGVCGTITITKGVTSVTATKGANTPNSIGAGDGGQDITVNIENGANVTQK